jgi:hypothetical protein
MKTISIQEADYYSMQQKIAELETKVNLLQNDEFMRNLQLAYQFFVLNKQDRKTETTQNETQVSLKRGSGKQLITFMSEDFDEPLSDFNEYM